MTTTFRVLFQGAMRHSCFADGVRRELATTPTPATAERLRRLGWLANATHPVLQALNDYSTGAMDCSSCG